MSQETAMDTATVVTVPINDLELHKIKFDEFIDKKYKNSSKCSKIMFREEDEKYLRYLEHKDKNLTPIKRNSE
jgi:hypothetical protein